MRVEKDSQTQKNMVGNTPFDGMGVGEMTRAIDSRGMNVAQWYNEQLNSIGQYEISNSDVSS
jgi:hypothetical protein